MKEILSAKKINKTFEISKTNTYTALKDVDITISKGEFVSVMGPSGSGKSTLLYNVSGMDRASSGKVEFMGKELTGMDDKELSKTRLKDMGFVFQQSHLLKDLNIIDNIILPGASAKKESKKVITDRANKLMKELGIDEIAKNKITEASGGQLQRVSICRALINQPEILFGDEPTGALNTKAAKDVMDILKDINSKGTTVMLVTHDPKVAAKCDKVMFMADGELVSEIELGKYGDEETIKDRETTLTKWLVDLGL